MGIERIPLEELEKMKKKRIKNLRKKGRAGQHEDFLYEQEVTPAEKKRYKAAVKMGDTEYKLGTKGYPKPKGPKFGAQPFKKSDGGILEKFKAFLASGEKPKGQIGKGSADTITGKIRVRKSVKEKEAEARKAKNKAKKNNTTDAKAKTAVEQLMSGSGTGAGAAGGMGARPSMQGAGGGAKPTVTPGAPGGMGAMMKMKKGGKVKTKGYAKGGKVRGAGIAKKGVKPCKMR